MSRNTISEWIAFEEKEPEIGQEVILKQTLQHKCVWDGNEFIMTENGWLNPRQTNPHTKSLEWKDLNS